MRSRKIEEYKSKLSLSKRQKEILIGVILGDGHIEKLYNPILGKLKIEHSYKQKDYVDWLYREFRSWVRSKPRLRKVKAFGKIYWKYGFATYGHRLLGEFRERFYKGKKKVVPRSLEKDITPLGLAVLYMDDGSIKSKRHKGVFLNTQGFEDDELRILQKILENKFGIKSTTREQTRGKITKKQIYFGGEAGERLIALIRPYIIPSMEYKIPRALRLTKLPKR